MSTLFNIMTGGLIAGLIASCGGCSSAARGGETPVALTPADSTLGQQARMLTLYRGTDGAATTWDALIAAMTEANAVIIGENHGHKLGLAFASELWTDVLAQREHAALSMEFFNRDEQSRLDDYLKGLWDEPAFLKATRRTTDEIYPPGHRAMVEAAKAHGRPVIASNAPRTYVRSASKTSYEHLASLTPEQQRMFRIPDELPTGKYRADYDALMSDPAMASHVGPPTKETPEALSKRLDSGFRAQSLWDWTMADSIAHGVEREGGPVVHIVGRFHSDFYGGLVQALRKMRPNTTIVTVSVVDASSETLRTEDMGRADFVVYVGKLDE